jgi:hypothetical protein
LNTKTTTTYSVRKPGSGKVAKCAWVKPVNVISSLFSSLLNLQREYRYKQTEHLHRFTSTKEAHTIIKLMDDITMDNAIAGSVNTGI